jgi:hypothetical protein
MKFPASLWIDKGEELLEGLQRAKRIAKNKKFALSDCFRQLFYEDETLSGKVESVFNDLDWLYDQVVKSYQKALEASKKFSAKLDGTAQAEASREDILAVMEYEATTHAASQLVKLALFEYGVIESQMEAYPDLKDRLLKILDWGS